ncbi:MAG: hypothetical protein AABZ74_05660 [Cyanobacteriota bacterium]
MNENIVILARPHNIIVDTIKELLTRNNYIPKPLKNLTDINEINYLNKVKGVVISTAVVSEIKESYIETFYEIRKKLPYVPIIFATLVNNENMSKLISLSLSRTIKDFKIFKINNETILDNSLGSFSSFILISKEEIDMNPEITDKILKKHFLI